MGFFCILYALLEKELTYISMNFDHYKNQLSKKKF